jgi:hypothetical protein
MEAKRRADPCVISRLTGRPNCVRLSPGASAATAPSPRISIIGVTASFTPDDLPVRTANLPLMYAVPIPPTGPVPSVLPTMCGMLAPS